MGKTAGSLAREATQIKDSATANAAALTPGQTATDTNGRVASPRSNPPAATATGLDQASDFVPPPAFDAPILDSLDMDVDLFGYFDPDFDLGAIDTALEANLDMGIPQNWALETVESTD